VSEGRSIPKPVEAPSGHERRTGASTGSRVHGLYAVTPDEPDTAALVEKVRQALRGGARVVQYRNKTASGPVRRQQAAELLDICRKMSAPLIVNDDLELAIALDADGVHLGHGDADLADARRRLAPGKLLGASCYDRIDTARSAIDRGADYVAFGAAFATAIKPGAPRAPLSLYAQAKAELGVPIVAIGGVTPDNAGALKAAGVDAVAVITALFGARDIEGRAREFCRIFE
jgi:thiamine-phosphate pyrophosphorylase